MKPKKQRLTTDEPVHPWVQAIESLVSAFEGLSGQKREAISQEAFTLLANLNEFIKTVKANVKVNVRVGPLVEVFVDAERSSQSVVPAEAD